jgi:Protein of unknown function DUF86
LSKLDPALAARIPELSKIVAFRNQLIHGYAAVDDQVVMEHHAKLIAPFDGGGESFVARVECYFKVAPMTTRATFTWLRPGAR